MWITHNIALNPDGYFPSGFNAILFSLSLKANFNKIGEIIVVTTTTITIGPNSTLESTPSAAP